MEKSDERANCKRGTEEKKREVVEVKGAQAWLLEGRKYKVWISLYKVFRGKRRRCEIGEKMARSSLRSKTQNSTSKKKRKEKLSNLWTRMLTYFNSFFSVPFLFLDLGEESGLITAVDVPFLFAAFFFALHRSNKQIDDPKLVGSERQNNGKKEREEEVLLVSLIPASSNS